MAEGDAVVGWRAREEAVDNGGREARGRERRDVEQVEVGRGWGRGRGPRPRGDPTRSKAARSLRAPGSADRPLPRVEPRAGPPRLGPWRAGPGKPRGPARRWLCGLVVGRGVVGPAARRERSSRRRA